MELPQEIEAFYTLPAVRRELARRLVQNGLTQRAVARKLDVTEAAVSQYLSNKRGTSVEYPSNINQAFNLSVNRISATNEVSSVRKEILQLSELMKQHKVICAIHKQHGNVKDDCSTCFE